MMSVASDNPVYQEMQKSLYSSQVNIRTLATQIALQKRQIADLKGKADKIRCPSQPDAADAQLRHYQEAIRSVAGAFEYGRYVAGRDAERQQLEISRDQPAGRAAATLQPETRAVAAGGVRARGGSRRRVCVFHAQDQ